jgi:hypothetical protein
MEIANIKGVKIHSLDEWLDYAPPAKGKAQWANGRSAKELARLWLKNGKPEMPSELMELLESNEATSQFIPSCAMPEFEAVLDEYRGKGRNHDLIIVGKSGTEKTLIAIEAKVDESFGEVVKQYLEKSIAKSPRSKVPDRIRELSGAIFGDLDTDSLRYQLENIAKTGKSILSFGRFIYSLCKSNPGVASLRISTT